MGQAPRRWIARHWAAAWRGRSRACRCRRRAAPGGAPRRATDAGSRRASGRRGFPRGRAPPWRSSARPGPDRPRHRPGRRAAGGARSRRRGRRGRARRPGSRSTRARSAASDRARAAARPAEARAAAPARAPAMLSATTPAVTTASSSELLARRLAPCRPRRRHLAAGPQAFDGAAALGVHGDAAHVVVRRRPHRDRLDRRDRCRRPGSALRCRGSAPRSPAPSACAGIEEDAVAGGDVSGHGARDDVARLELGAALPRHEALAGFVDQHGALAAHGLADQRHGIEPDGERGRMELHELHVGRAPRRRAPPAPGPGRWRPADWSCGRRDRPARRWRARRDGSAAGRRSTAPPPARRRCRDRRPAGGAPPAPRHGDRGRGGHRGDQGAHDRRPRAVARDMDDATAAVRGLQAEREAARRRRGRRRRRSARARRWRPAPPRRCGRRRRDR